MPADRRPRDRPRKHDPLDRAAAKTPTGRPSGRSETSEEKSEGKSKTLSAYGFQHAIGDEFLATGATSGLGTTQAPTEGKSSESESTPNSTQINDKDASSASESAPQQFPAPAPLQRGNLLRAPKKSVGPGERDVFFANNEEWQQHHESKLGTKTRKLTFGRGFTLEDVHIDQLIAMGPTVCGSLWNFVFNYQDDGFGSRNHARDLTEEAIVRLAENCPNLRCVQLQGTGNLTDRALICFFQNCADLTDLEISHAEWYLGSMTGTAFDTLRTRPDWAPKLIKLCVKNYESKAFMKAMRELTRARQKLLIQLKTIHIRAKHRDSDDTLNITVANYLNGMIRNEMKHIKRRKDGYSREVPQWDPKKYERYQQFRYQQLKHWNDSHTWSNERMQRELSKVGLGSRRYR